MKLDRIRRLLELRERIESAAAGELAVSNRQRNAAESRLEESVTSMEMAARGLRSTNSAGERAVAQAWLDARRQGVTQSQDELVVAEDLVRAREAVMTDRRIERKKMERFLELATEREQTEDRRKERSTLDEIALHRFAWSSAE